MHVHSRCAVGFALMIRVALVIVAIWSLPAETLGYTETITAPSTPGV